MGIEKQTQEIELGVRGLARALYDRDEVYLPSMPAVIPAACSQD
jgi:hypothetical protein